MLKILRQWFCRGFIIFFIFIVALIVCLGFVFGPCFVKIVSEYDQEIPQSQTADNIVRRVFSSFAIIVLVGLF